MSVGVAPVGQPLVHGLVRVRKNNKTLAEKNLLTNVYGVPTTTNLNMDSIFNGCCLLLLWPRAGWDVNPQTYMYNAILTSRKL